LKSKKKLLRIFWEKIKVMQSAASSTSYLAHRVNVINLYKQLYKHLLTSNEANTKQARLNLRNQFAENSVSDGKYCVESSQMYFLGNVFLTYLRSTQETLALYGRYAKGERSIEESAAIVGLRLPKQYEPPKE
jgi:hypothetical protein